MKVSTLIGSNRALGAAEPIRVAAGAPVTLTASGLGTGEYFELEINIGSGEWGPLRINDGVNPFRLTDSWNTRTIPYPGHYRVIKKFAGTGRVALHR